MDIKIHASPNKKKKRLSDKSFKISPTKLNKSALEDIDQNLSNRIETSRSYVIDVPTITASEVEPLLPDPVHQRKQAKERENTAVNYLRDLSEEDSNNFRVSSLLGPMKIDAESLDNSDKLCPFLEPCKKPTLDSNRAHKPIISLKSNSNKLAKDIKPFTGEINSQKSRKIMRLFDTEPNEETETARTEVEKTSQVLYSKPWEDGLDGEVLADQMNQRAKKRIEDSIDVTDNRYDTERGFSSQEIDDYSFKRMVKETNRQPLLQIRRLNTEQITNFSQESRQNFETKMLKHLKGLSGSRTKKPKSTSVMPGKISYLREIILNKSKQAKEAQSGPIMMFGRSLSMSKLLLNEDDNTKKSSSRTNNNTRNGGLEYFKDKNLFNEHIIKRKVMRRNPRNISEVTRNLNDSGSGREDLSARVRCETELTAERTNESLLDKRLFNGEMKIGIWFKAKKGLLEPLVKPEEPDLKKSDLELKHKNQMAQPIKGEKECKDKSVKDQMSYKLKMPALKNIKKANPLESSIVLELNEATKIREKFKVAMSNKPMKSRILKPIDKNDSIRNLIAKASVQHIEEKFEGFKGLCKPLVPNHSLSNLLNMNKADLENTITN